MGLSTNSDGLKVGDYVEILSYEERHTQPIYTRARILSLDRDYLFVVLACETIHSITKISELEIFISKTPSKNPKFIGLKWGEI